jgi:hypothetical protein
MTIALVVPEVAARPARRAARPDVLKAIASE